MEFPGKNEHYGDVEDDTIIKESILGINIQSIDEKGNFKPRDFLYIALFLFFLQGMGILFPWNAFISAPDYFLNVLGPSSMTLFGVFYSIPNIISLAGMTIFGKWVPLSVAVLPSYLAMFVALVAMPIAMYTPLITLDKLGYIFTLLMVVVCGLMTSSVQSGIFGFAGIMPGTYMTAVMSGNGVSGVIVSLLRALTKIVIEREGTVEQQRLSVTIFFSVAALVLLVCIVTFILLLRLPVSKYYLNKSKGEPEKQFDDEDTENELDRIIRESTESLYENQNAPNEETAIFKVETNENKSTNILIVFSKIWREALGVFITFLVSLCVFPGLCLSIPSKYDLLQNGWLQILIVIQFNVWDTVGRTLPIASQTLNKFCKKIIDIPILLRLLFIPIICLSLKFENTFLANDIFILFLILVLSFTNGYFSSLLMTYAPMKVEAHEGRLAGTMMTFFLVGGIVAGTNLSLVIGYLLKFV